MRGVVFALTILMAPQSALACICAAPSEEEAYERADVIFVGRAIATVEYQYEWVRGEEVREVVGNPIMFEIEEHIKGAKGIHILVHNNTDAAACGYPFDIGSVYKVYASEIPVGGLTPMGPAGEYGTRTCSGTVEIPDE